MFENVMLYLPADDAPVVAAKSMSFFSSLSRFSMLIKTAGFTSDLSSSAKDTQIVVSAKPKL